MGNDLPSMNLLYCVLCLLTQEPSLNSEVSGTVLVLCTPSTINVKHIPTYSELSLYTFGTLQSPCFALYSITSSIRFIQPSSSRSKPVQPHPTMFVLLPSSHKRLLSKLHVAAITASNSPNKLVQPVLTNGKTIGASPWISFSSSILSRNPFIPELK
jgi:hypothetical protein